jgi:hypothetical protein
VSTQTKSQQAPQAFPPSLAAAEARVERRLGTARTRHIAIDVRIDGDEISGQAADGTGRPRSFRGWVGLIGALDRLLASPATDEIV